MSSYSLINSGFTFNQSAVPSSPARGNTWRERSGNGDIVQDWFWNGTLWLSIEQKTIGGQLQISAAGQTGPYAQNYHISPYNTFLEEVIFTSQYTTTDLAVNYWRVDLLRYLFASGGALQINGSPIDLKPNALGLTRVAINQVFSTGFKNTVSGTSAPAGSHAGFDIYTNKINAPGNMLLSYGYIYRFTR